VKQVLIIGIQRPKDQIFHVRTPVNPSEDHFRGGQTRPTRDENLECRRFSVVPIRSDGGDRLEPLFQIMTFEMICGGLGPGRTCTPEAGDLIDALGVEQNLM